LKFYAHYDQNAYMNNKWNGPTLENVETAQNKLLSFNLLKSNVILNNHFFGTAFRTTKIYKEV